ncbi:histidine ammonia-lyase [Pseudomonadota bacterium]
MKSMEISPGKLSYDQLFRVHSEPLTVSLNDDCIEGIERSADVVGEVIKEGRTVYGINTGFGLLANTKISPEELETLQRSIVLSHAAGVGEHMKDSTVRLIMVLKINSLARGMSGVRLSIINALMALLNREIYPCIPCKGSVGASGDLAPLAHMAAVLLGEGFARHKGNIITAQGALSLVGLQPVVLAPKEGLALLNGTQVSTALALQGLFMSNNALSSATVIGALSVDAARGSRVPFDERLHRAQGHKSVIDMGALYRCLLQHSQIEESHRDCERVQDPYSLRCQPQVMGACLQQIRNAAGIILIEANGVSDNPLVFSNEREILSGGNFHAEAIAMAADNLALALAEIGALSERRMALLIDSRLSGLPPFLVDNGGINSGFMMAQVTSAALASENKTLAHPASVDSLPTSANQEDHVSMATFAARRLADMYENTANILAIEWLAACQGLDFLNPLKTSKTLEQAKTVLRNEVPFYDKDRYFSPDIEKAANLIKKDALKVLVDMCVV